MKFKLRKLKFHLEVFHRALAVLLRIVRYTTGGPRDRAVALYFGVGIRAYLIFPDQ